MNKTKKNKMLENFHIFGYALVIFLVGAIILGCLQYHEFKVIHTNEDVPTVFETAENVETENYNTENKLSNEYLYFWQPILYNIGVILIVLAIGTMLFELFGYVTFFQKRLAEVFTEKRIVNILNDEYKKQLKTNLLESIYKPDGDDSRNLINFFDNKLSNIMDTYYYDEHDTFVECYVLEDKYIMKNITRIIVFKEINSSKENSIDELISVSYKELDKKCKYDAFTMKEIEVNGIKLTEKDYNIKYEELNNPYSKRVTYCLNEKKEINNSLRIKMVYTSVVPINDCFYSVKINRLCKQMKSRLTFENDNYEVHVKGFNFSTKPETDYICEHYDSVIEANSNGWLLPGEGIVYAFFRKKLDTNTSKGYYNGSKGKENCFLYKNRRGY